jgi:UDP-2,3-diacylglucosamine pyrophosphatase LpxH
MSIIVASDFHIGNANSKHLKFVEFLKTQEDVDFIVLAGDILDLWVERLDRVLKEADPLFGYLMDNYTGKVIYLYGNHDEDLRFARSLSNIPIRHHHILSKHDIHILHGHQYDDNFYLRKTKFLAKFNSKVVNWADRVFKIDIRKFLVSLSDYVDNDPYDKILRDYENTLRQFIEARVVITGHTHIPIIKTFPEFIYVNCGTWVQHQTCVRINENSLELLDCGGGEAKVLDWIRL